MCISYDAVQLLIETWSSVSSAPANAQMYSLPHTYAMHGKMQAQPNSGVMQFLSLKINPATKLIYLFLSLALLHTSSSLKIGFPYKPMRYTLLQPNLKTCLEKWLRVWDVFFFACVFHLGSI